MRIVAYNTELKNGKVLLEESTGEHILSNDLDELFSFLVEPYDGCIKVCWALDAMVSLFLRLLGTAKCSQLKATKKCHIAPFEVFYVPEKVFSVSHIPTKGKANLYGMEQYFVEVPEPGRLSEVQGLAEYLMKELKQMGLEPTKLTSPVAIYEECVMGKLPLPRLKDLPLGAAEFAYRCAGRLWIETHIIAYFEKVWDYDLISAFPNIAKDLVDTRQCLWMQSAEYQAEAVYGYVKCNVTIYDWVMVSPIIMEIDEGLLSPVGTWEGYLTKDELDFITKWQIGEYEILDGWWAVPKTALKKPLCEPMEKLLRYKQGTALQALLAKRMATGVYGKLGEEREEEFGPFFNPCWFAEISTQAKLQVGEFLYSKGIGPGDNEGRKHLVHIGVDGVMLTNEFDIGKDNGWRLEYEGEALVFSSGLVYTQTTKPKGLRLNEVKQMIKDHPRTSYYHRGLTRRLTLGDSLAQHRLEDVGKEMEFSVSLSLVNQEHDRVFAKLPRSGEQLMNNKYRSKPRRV